MMLVGKQAMGKSTLVARLHNKDILSESTVGIDVSEWKYSSAYSKKPSILVFGILLVRRSTMPPINVFCLSIHYTC